MKHQNCDYCKKPVDTKPRRICWKCKQSVGNHDKWYFREDGRIEHRHCDRPQYYT